MATSASPQVSSDTAKNLFHQIVIVGGGAAGITTAAQLLAKNSFLDIAIIEPSDKHYYQPGWTLVGGGIFTMEDTVKEQKSCIPRGTTWIQDSVIQLDPDRNVVITQAGKRIEYEYLVLCPGIQIDWHLIKGLKEALGHDGVTSNYSKEYASYTWEAIRNFQGGTAIFTFPSTPIKCAGAPQKIMYLADDFFKRQSRVTANTTVMFCSAAATLFAVPEYCTALEKVVERRKIQVKFKHELKEIKTETKEAIFDVTTDNDIQEISIKYDLIHVAPPMSAPDFVKTSPLAIQTGPQKGWIDVNKYTLQHNLYPNVFSLGDASSLPTSKTAAAIRKQAPVLVENLLTVLSSGSVSSQYNGYTCCPLITGYGTTIMAEFDYDKKPVPSFPGDSSEERYTMWLVKRHILPWIYWNRMLKGKAFEADLLKLRRNNRSLR